MRIQAGGRDAITIDDAVFRRLLSIHPEENLSQERPILRAALVNGFIELRLLQEECQKIRMPWQMFLLDEESLEEEFSNIEQNRNAKVGERFFARRQGGGGLSSTRILDRLIRSQAFVVGSRQFSANTFCGALQGLSEQEAVEAIIRTFELDMAHFREISKESALKYLVRQIENKQINISQGVLSNGLLPEFPSVRKVYKNTSGFVIHDECIPYIFIPSEVNPEERDGRQIFTLVYLTVLIGLGAYGYIIGNDFAQRALNSRGQEALAYNITGALLLPRSVTETYRNRRITPEIREQLASEYKITPTAVIVMLRKRNIIDFREYEALKPATVIVPTNGPRRSAAIQNSVRKFCGKYAFDAINLALRSRALFPIQAQYIIFGSVQKRQFKEYTRYLNNK